MVPRRGSLRIFRYRTRDKLEPGAPGRRQGRTSPPGWSLGPITASYVNKETDRTQARRARDRPPGHVYFSALGVTCQLDVLPSPSPSTSSPRVVPAVRPFDPDVPDAAEPWGGHLRPSGYGLSRPNRLASCGFPVDFEALSAHPSVGRERWSVTGPLSSGFQVDFKGPERPGSRSLDVLLCRRWLLNPPRARSYCA